MFVDLFPTRRGRPSVPADVIATVMVLQALEGLSDREAVRQLETNIAWKAATGLALTDEAFHSGDLGGGDELEPFGDTTLIGIGRLPSAH